MGLKKMYQEAWKSIIMPPKFLFDKYHLGPERQTINQEQIRKYTFKVKNKEGHLLEGNFYHPTKSSPGKKLNIVVYLHTRGGCRLEGIFLLKIILPKFGLLIFDFAGSAYSEGQYITLGVNEAEDTRIVIDHIKNNFPIGKVVLWGRSMGAVTSLVYSSKEENGKTVDGIVLDSPFSCFQTMVNDIVRQRVNIPLCFVNSALYFMNNTIKNKIKVDLKKLKPIELVKKCTIPAFFFVCKDDVISRPDRVKDLYNQYGGKVKEFHLIPGEHQTIRDNQIIVKAIHFILRVMKNEQASPVEEVESP